jgi:retron-type reverse transcriptase
MYTRLTRFIEKYEILYNKQFGFRSKHSTLQAALSITDNIQQAIEKGWYSCGIFLDFSKAFDTVNHDILLNKLDHYGIRGLAYDWFSSYLSNRCQFVSIRHIKSDETPIKYGVPQGSVLGPLLFLLYIHDFHNCSDIFKFNIFADDTNLFHTNANLVNLEITINRNLEKIFDWLAANKLSLNIDKTNFVLFHPPQRTPNHVIALFIIFILKSMVFPAI